MNKKRWIAVLILCRLIGYFVGIIKFDATARRGADGEHQ